MAKQTHSSKYMILLECLHAQSHVSSPHRLPHTCLSKMRAKIQFSEQKLFVLKNTLLSFGKYIGLPSKVNCWIIFFEQSWIHLRDELLDHSPRQFFGKSSLKFISQPFSFFFQFLHVIHSHLPSRVPRCIWNALCHFQTIHANIFYMYILTKFDSHNSCYLIHNQ